MHAFVNETDDPDKEEYIQAPVIIAPDAGTVRVAGFSTESGVIELTIGGAYCMTISDDGLSVRPVECCFTDIRDSGEYIIEK